MAKVNNDKFKVFESVFDESTLSTLEIMKRKKYFDELGKPSKTGKEGDVYFAYGDNDKTYALKIYRMSTSSFRKISQHIAKDYRFKNIKGNLRKVILRWTQKEYRNILLCYKNNINVPYPYKQINNVILMDYIEGDMLKDTYLTNPKEFFELLLAELDKMINEAKLIHGDLSEFNILVKDQVPVIIDLGQALLIKNEQDFKDNFDLFERDILNITNYFNRKYKLDLDRDEIVKKLVR
jgi:RIO kinase 1